MKIKDSHAKTYHKCPLCGFKCSEAAAKIFLASRKTAKPTTPANIAEDKPPGKVR